MDEKLFFDLNWKKGWEKNEPVIETFQTVRPVQKSIEFKAEEIDQFIMGSSIGFINFLHQETPGDADALQVVTLPRSHPGADEVLIKVAAAGVNRADILQRRGFPPSAWCFSHYWRRCLSVGGGEKGGL